MAKCKDCLHYEACSAFSKIINAARDVEKGCEHFKNSTKYVEVVRCKDCSVPHNKWTGCPILLGLVLPPDFYCAFGERREGE